jgi:hypothetical protein
MPEKVPDKKIQRTAGLCSKTKKYPDLVFITGYKSK